MCNSDVYVSTSGAQHPVCMSGSGIPTTVYLTVSLIIGLQASHEAEEHDAAMLAGMPDCSVSPAYKLALFLAPNAEAALRHALSLCRATCPPHDHYYCAPAPRLTHDTKRQAPLHSSSMAHCCTLLMLLLCPPAGPDPASLVSLGASEEVETYKTILACM